MRRIIFSMSLLVCTPVFAADSHVSACIGIDDNQTRLACYDAVAGRSTSTKQAADTAAMKPVRPVAPTAPRSAEVATRPSTPAPAPASAKKEVEDFGFEHLGRDDKERIVSRYDGTFTGWSGRTLFKLENGQVWRQSDTGRFQTTMEHPTLIIERAAFGSYRLKIEGLNRSVRVKRVR